MKENYKNKWYKVWFDRVSYNGAKYSTFEYAFGDKQVKKLIEKLNAHKVTEWII